MESLITFADKQQLNANALIPVNQKGRAVDWNEIKNSLNNYVGAGWYPVPSTLSYASADSPTFVMNSSVDLTSLLSKGMKLQIEQDQALSAYWDLNSNANSQVGSYNGTETNITHSAGKFGNCAVFNGTTSKIAFADNAVFKPTGSFTIGAWVKTNVTGSYKTIFQSASQNTNAGGISFLIGSSNALYLAIGNNTQSSYNTNLVGNINVCDNNWHYVVATYNNNYCQIYVDGKLDVSSYTVAPAYAATNYVRFGCENKTGTDTTFMNGSIDDLYLINGYALDEETIKAKYVANTAQGTGNITIKKKAFITDISTTQITCYCGTDFAVANTTIYNPMYSMQKSPYNFNNNPTKWRVLVADYTNRNQANPVQNQWYNIGGIYIDIPIGLWENVGYSMLPYSYRTAANNNIQTEFTLSTANNAVSDSSMSGAQYGGVFVAPAELGMSVTIKKPTTLVLNAKTRYYILTRTITTNITSINNQNATQTLFITAVCAYL